MKATGIRYSISRQKACQQCSAAKAKCDRKAGCCSRCTLRDLSCTYPQSLPSRGSAHIASESETGLYNNPLSAPAILPTSEGLVPSPEHESPAEAGLYSSTGELGQSTSENYSASTNNSSVTFTGDLNPKGSALHAASRPCAGLDTLDFSDLELLTLINVEDISNRWLNSYIPVPGQKPKDYPASITAFICRILKSYVAVTVRGRGAPPFVHSSQIMAASIRQPLSTCLSLVRVCDNPLPGSESVAADVLQREMSSLHEQHGTFDDVTLLAAFQAYLIYSMVLFFKLGQVSSAYLRQAMMNLQQLACSSGRGGLVSVAEQQRARPKWEAWIVAEAKRRTLYTMYLFDSALSTQDGLPTFLGTELEGLPASASKSLWSAQSRHEWETAYNIYLADGLQGGLRIDELWPIPPDLDEDGVAQRRRRVDQWLEDIDEFGTMLYAVTSCTHGG